MTGRAQRASRRALGALAAALLGCAGQPPASPELLISGLRMENHTRFFVTAARVLVPATGNFVSCGGIAPGGVCATRFPESRFSGNPVEISWSQDGQIWSTGELEVAPGVEAREAGVAIVQVIIAGPGSAGLRLVPDPAGAP